MSDLFAFPDFMLLSYFENSCSWMDFSASVPDLNKNEEDDQVGNGSIEMQQLVCGMTGGDGGAWTWWPYLPINTYKIFANKI